MKRAVGPLDKRRTATRCQACSRRRIKCEGGYPCKYCVRTNKPCELQQPLVTEVKFVAVANPVQSCQTNQLGARVYKHRETLYLDQFASFMQRCQFTRGFASVTTNLVHLMQESPSLRDVATAIGALEASRRSSVISFRGHGSPGYTALSLYGRSIKALQTEVTNIVSVRREDTLWSTFLLGLFELLSETVGDRWAQHMRYGTSRLLQLAGPTESLSTLYQTLFEAFRVLEATRAVMYGDGTFLSHNTWLSYHPSPTTKRSGTPNPMTSMDTLIIQTSAFSHQLFERLNCVPEHLRSTDPEIDALVSDGIQIQHKLRCWHDDNTPYSSLDSYVQLAFANYHALELFHCRNFTYHSCWTNKTVPSLTQSEIEAHVSSILRLSEQCLEASVIPGVTLLFPLRMAGANTLPMENRTKVVDILGRIHQSGFIVSERIKVDVQELWGFLAAQNGSVQRNE